MKFRKKPVVIEAVQFKGTNKSVDEIHEFAGETIIVWHMHSNSLTVPTLEGNMTANIGDWIIKGVSNEFYPCKPDIFEKTYEVVEE